MYYLKKMKFTRAELAEMEELLDGYIWVAIDARRGIISAGDEFVPDLRDALIVRRSKLEDIYGFGLDLATGEIDYLNGCNRRNPIVGCDGQISDERKDRIETLIHYFFDGLETYASDPSHPHYVRKPADTSSQASF